MHTHHENISKAPVEGSIGRAPMKGKLRGSYASNIWRIFDIPKGEIGHPRNDLSKANTIASACFTKQLIYPAVGKLHQERAQQTEQQSRRYC